MHPRLFHAPHFLTGWSLSSHVVPGVPTIHQAILAHADRHREVIARCPLRFIRSSTAFLPPQVRAALKAGLSCPVIESYGMTETSIIICNPPLQHRLSLVQLGWPSGPEVAIMDESGTSSSRDRRNRRAWAECHAGLRQRSRSKREAFTHGWFRTGDQGFLDADGYLFVTGRLKEMINRGGEKIAPWEVDAVLTEHPAVAQAVTFAVPHARLGEDIAAAVVLRRNAMATASDIRQFVAMRLAAFKVPSQVLLVEACLKAPTGNCNVGV